MPRRLSWVRLVRRPYRKYNGGEAMPPIIPSLPSFARRGLANLGEASEPTQRQPMANKGAAA